MYICRPLGGLPYSIITSKFKLWSFFLKFVSNSESHDFVYFEFNQVLIAAGYSFRTNDQVNFFIIIYFFLPMYYLL